MGLIFILLCIRHPTVLAKALCFRAVRLLRLFVCSSVRSSGQILLPQFLMNGLSNLHGTYREYSLAPTDDLIKYCVSQVKVTAGR